MARTLQKGIRSMRTATRRTPLIGVVAAAFVVLLGGAAAEAHSKKKSSVPSDGASLAAPPNMIMLNFDAPTMVTLFRLTDIVGTAVDVEGGSMDPATEYIVAPAALSPGTYSVEWRGLSSDGHPVEGRFSFTVQ